MTKKSNNWLELDKETRDFLIAKYLQRTKTGNGDEEEAIRIKSKILAQEAYERSVGYGIPANAAKVYSQEVTQKYGISDYSPSPQLNKFFENSVYETLKKSAPQFNFLFDYVYKTDIREEREENQESPSEVIKKKVIELKPREETKPIKPSLERVVASENFLIPNKERARARPSLENAVFNYESADYSPIFNISKESKSSFNRGFLTGLAPIVDPFGYISSLVYRQKTETEFENKNSLGTVFNKIYSRVYSNNPKTPYVPKILGNFAGLGVATGAVVGLSFINPLLGLAIPALTGFYSLYKTIKKAFSNEKKNGN